MVTWEKTCVCFKEKSNSQARRKQNKIKTKTAKKVDKLQDKVPAYYFHLIFCLLTFGNKRLASLRLET